MIQNSKGYTRKGLPHTLIPSYQVPLLGSNQCYYFLSILSKIYSFFWAMVYACNPSTQEEQKFKARLDLHKETLSQINKKAYFSYPSSSPFYNTKGGILYTQLSLIFFGCSCVHYMHLRICSHNLLASWKGSVFITEQLVILRPKDVKVTFPVLELGLNWVFQYY
jgi:hypothetical protein